MTAPLLSVRGLRIAFDGAGGPVEVVSGVDLDVAPGEAVALVGESGCGKSVTARSTLRLLREPPARIRAERLDVVGQPVLELGAAALRRMRGERVGFVFQDPMTALNPVLTVGEQIAERIRRFRGLDRRAAWARAVELLAEVGIPAPDRRAREHPHRMSGGMRQRAVIAIALAADPELLIADEPTTALDVTIQAQIMRLIRRLQTDRGLGILLISHDLGVVAQAVDRVVVMYAGQVVEEAPVEALFERPRHPYARGLLRSVPGAAPASPSSGGHRLWSIPGMVPAPADFPTSCRFADRCARVEPACRAEPVGLRDPGDPGCPEARVRCLFPHDEPLAAPPAE